MCVPLCNNTGFRCTFVSVIVQMFLLVCVDMACKRKRLVRVTHYCLLCVPLEVVLLLFDACSNGIVHRDIKPENLLLSEPSTKGIVQLSDFGLSAFLAPGRGN